MTTLTKLKEAGKWILVFTIVSTLFLVVEQLINFIFDQFIFDQCTSNLQHIFSNFLFTFLIPCLLFLVVTLLTIRWINRKKNFNDKNNIR